MDFEKAVEILSIYSFLRDRVEFSDELIDEAIKAVFIHYVKTGDAVSGSLIDKSVCKYHLPCGLCEKGIYRVCRLDRKEAEHENSERTGIS